MPAAELPEPPRLGDVILDGDDRRWTILIVKRTTLGVRWRCETRDVAIAHGLDDTISVLKATAPGGYGEPTWQTWKTGIRARIQPIATKIDAATPSTTMTYRIFVEENLAWITPARSAVPTEPSIASPAQRARTDRRVAGDRGRDSG